MRTHRQPRSPRFSVTVCFAAASLLQVALLSGCSLFVNPDEGQLGNVTGDGSVRDGQISPPDGGVEAGPACDENTCDDGIECTVDTCSGEPTVCNNQPNHGACGEDQRCDPIRGGCTAACTNNAECDNGNPCDGEETCNQDTGECASGQAMQCGTEGECRRGTCNPDSGSCDFSLDDALCESSGMCQVGSCTERGCELTERNCDDGNACTNDHCDEETGCFSELIDEDDDGQAPSGLGNCGTDCDDDDPTRYAGATEYCDGVDSNCNGRSDEQDDCIRIPDTCNSANGALPRIALGQTVEAWNGPIDVFDNDYFNSNYASDCFGNRTGPDAAFEVRIDGTADVLVEATGLSGDVDPKLMVVRAGTCGPAAFALSSFLCNEDATLGTQDARIWVQDTQGFDLLLETGTNNTGNVKVTVTAMSPKPQVCGNAIDISAGGTWIANINNDDDYGPDCGDGSDNNPQGIASFIGPNDGTVEATMRDSFDQSVLSLADQTCSNELACDGNGGANPRSISASVTSGTTYHLVAQGGSPGPATFAVEFKP